MIYAIIICAVVWVAATVLCWFDGDGWESAVGGLFYATVVAGLLVLMWALTHFTFWVVS